MSTSSTRLRQSPSTPWRRVGDEILLAPPSRDDFDQLSGTAAVVWSVLEEPCSREELVTELAEMYSIPPEGIVADVGTLLADLLQRGVIEEIPERP
ncbi:MAG: PqqD family protein [Actinomycetota bacterium]